MGPMLTSNVWPCKCGAWVYEHLRQCPHCFRNLPNEMENKTMDENISQQVERNLADEAKMYTKEPYYGIREKDIAWNAVPQHRLEATLQVTSKDGSKRPHQIFSGFSADLASNTIRNFVDESLHSSDLKSGDKVKIEVVVL
jgi:hypothetical protein